MVMNPIEKESQWPAKPADINNEEAELDRVEVVRLIAQCLEDFGLPQSAESLENESGISALSTSVKVFRQCILAGNWDELENVLESLGKFRSEEDYRNARFVLYRQYYLELLESGQKIEALSSLRKKLEPCCGQREQLKELSLLVICKTPEELRRRAKWNGVESRAEVLRAVQSYIPSSVMLPEKRLQALLRQAMMYQKDSAQYPYTKQSHLSLLEDLEYSNDRIPTVASRVLTKHKDEVWFVQFSHNGKWLVSASKDRTIIVWDVEKLRKSDDQSEAMLYTLEGQEDPLSFLSWSPDDSLLCCGNDKVIRMWSMETGTNVHSLEKHTDRVTACAWLNESSGLVSAGSDRKILFWVEVRGQWQTKDMILVSAQILDMAVARDASKLVTICSDNVIHIYDATTATEISTIKEEDSVMSLCLSVDGVSLLVNMSPVKIAPVIHEWDLTEEKLVQKYSGQRQSRFVIRSCFSGYNQMFVLSGSEDSNVYLWRRKNGSLIASLSGHSRTVNAVSWNPVDPFMFASASDDGTVRIWGSSSAVDSSAEPMNITD
eukprot:CAMPEP_0113963886 /NCGR_PEP_ID=MMETSP0011_2-20120614/6786_1 /TAXON_ID=101924 /ORGANISM="Rhodosorus marinus" /LENGTH=547 /DNA_ID=CAMNT_0000976033 /DNA_START=122 /DNA_END=1765 /DNA_ORIENTATION=- /assembly_acc=CAM_ASM_000156